MKKSKLILVKKQSSIWIKKSILLLGGIIAIPNIAFAGSEVATVIDNVCNWLSGEVAAAIAVLVVIYSGYEMLHGEIDKMKFMYRCIGIGMVIGGSYITKNYVLG